MQSSTPSATTALQQNPIWLWGGAAYIDEFIMLCAGAWMTAVGFGYVDLPTPANQPWLGDLVRQFKWMGPLLILIAIVLGVAAPS